MSNSLVIIVTGTSRGVGKGITTLLAQQKLYRPLIIYATSRGGVDTSIEAISPNKVKYGSLDITDPTSIQAFFGEVLNEHASIDVLINNAAVSNGYRENPEFAAQTIWNNYGGTRDMCKAFLSQPNIPSGARIVNLTSGFNALSTYGPDLQSRFRQASTIADIDALAKDYLNDMKSGPEVQERAGWRSGPRSYHVSKALINALTIVLSQQHPNVLVNCCCPGWTDTDMGKQGNGTPPKTPEEGAMTAVRLAIGELGPAGDEDGGLGKDTERLSGLFYENENIMAKDWGKAKKWLET
jgi:NAD(P)-dependent dehydrogenase (short-subunit alcohol dehydrogenase family)